MKLTKDLLRQLILEALEEGDVIQGKFGGGPAADLGKEASVTDIASRFKDSDESEMPEGTEWILDVAKLVDTILNVETLNKLGEADEELANKMHRLATDLLPIVRDYIPSANEIPEDAFLDDPEHVSQASTERSYDPSEQEPED